MKEIAKEFSLSPRQLQRNLNELNLNYQELKDEFRQQLIQDFVHQGYSLADIYALVGFHSDDALRKYFKKKFGMTFSEYVSNL